MIKPSELFIVGYPGQTLPVWLKKRLLTGHFAGLVFFRRNFTQPDCAQAVAENMRHLVATLPVDGPPAILSIDHEGGRVQRLRGDVTVWPPMLRLVHRPLLDLEEVGRAMAWELSALGFNVNFAPVLDTHTNPKNPIISDRAFGTTPQEVAQRALAFLRGLESEPGFRGCGKHFPGHGDTESDSHVALPVVRRPLSELIQTELMPFSAAAAQVGMLMTAHVVYPLADTKPATLSSFWLRDCLRLQVGFQGVVLSDDLDMAAVSAPSLGLADDGQVVVESLLAGCDAFLFCKDAERLARSEEALIHAAEQRSDVRQRITESAARLLRFRATLSAQGPRLHRLAEFPRADHRTLAG